MLTGSDVTRIWENVYCKLKFVFKIKLDLEVCLYIFVRVLDRLIIGGLMSSGNI